jgi:HPt (histidine-containing phosphotransfer) domain-containing protein
MNKEVLKEYGIDYEGARERFMDNKVLYEKLLQELFEREDIKKVEEALKLKEYETVHKYLHNMKGVAGNLGVNRVYEPVEMLLQFCQKVRKIR